MKVQATEEERATLWQEVWTCRKALAVEHKMLQEPPEKANFLTTTLRRSETHTNKPHPGRIFITYQEQVESVAPLVSGS